MMYGLNLVGGMLGVLVAMIVSLLITFAFHVTDNGVAVLIGLPLGSLGVLAGMALPPFWRKRR